MQMTAAGHVCIVVCVGTQSAQLWGHDCFHHNFKKHMSDLLGTGFHPQTVGKDLSLGGGSKQRAKVGLCSQAVGTDLWRVLGTSMVKLQGREGYLTWWAWRAEHWARENYSWALRSNGTCCTGFWICLVWSLLSYFLILPFGGNCLSYPCPIIVFWKQVTWLISQAHCEGSLPQDESYLRSCPSDLDDV